LDIVISVLYTFHFTFSLQGTIEGETYELKQFHFHTPSENNINGTSYPLETHFVHATKDGKLAVVAVMFKNIIKFFYLFFGYCHFSFIYMPFYIFTTGRGS
jgi:hypothetical protein